MNENATNAIGNYQGNKEKIPDYDIKEGPGNVCTKPSLPEIYKMATSVVSESRKLSEESHKILSTLIGKSIPAPLHNKEVIDNEEAGALGLITFALLGAVDEINKVSSHLSEIKKVVG